MARRFRSFADPDTEFEIVRSETPLDVDGFKIHEPTGEIRCEECGEQALRPEDIHEENSECKQADVTSRYERLCSSGRDLF